MAIDKSRALGILANVPKREELGAAKMFSLRLTNVARKNAEQLVRSGWTTTLTGAVHYALALAVKQDKERAA